MKLATLVPVLAFLLTGVAVACGSDDGKKLYVAPDGGAGSGASGGAAGSGGVGGSSGSAGGCRSDASCGGATPYCELSTGACVACLADVQCPDGRCVDKVCVENQSCSNSRDCVGSPRGSICDPVSKTCVECAAREDCTGTADCVANRCVTYTPCVNSRDCTAPEVCDTARGRCVRCTGDLDCDQAQVCVGNQCIVRTACQSDNQCTPLGKLCDRGLGYCVDCLRDGDCSQGLRCSSGSCVAGGCTPNARSCVGKDVVQCDATGTSTSVVERCPGACSNGTCTATFCTPNAPICDADVATRCTADGSGYVSGGTDCSATGKSCLDGSCVGGTCTTGTAPKTALKLAEVGVGTADYVILKNTSTSCSLDIGGLLLRVRSDTGGADVDVTLPTRTLGPGASVIVAEDTPRAGELPMPTVSLVPTSGAGAVFLCNGNCGVAGNVIDLFVFADGAASPSTSPVTFDTPLSGITTATENTQAFKRARYSGASPRFLAADWTVGATSRAYQNPPQCPRTQPVTSSACNFTVQTAPCIYGAVTCTCLIQWMCS